ncbi:MAG: hypothetical protein LAO56_14540 [Acidobacteriia bacterium]|nr:hypothetical protein [Terriglobia bacterium]
MAQAAAQYELGRAELGRALAILDREQQAMQLSRAQRLSYKLYTIFVWGFVLCIVGAIIDLATIEFKSAKTEPSWVFLTFAGAVGLCFLLSIALLVLNIPLVVKVIRNQRLFHRMGLSGVLGVLWKERQKTRRWMAIVERISLGLGILFLIPSIIIPIAAIVPRWRGPFLEMGWIEALFYFSIGTLFVMFFVLQRGKARLDMMTSRWRDVVHLKESMAALEKTAQQAGSERISFPLDVIEQFSRIETEQIAHSRAMAISESAKAPKLSFSILSSDEVLKAKAGLDPDTRLRVEEMIDELALQPKPSGVEMDADTGTLRQRVQETGWEIFYDVDDAGRQLRLLSLRQSAIAGQK